MKIINGSDGGNGTCVSGNSSGGAVSSIRVVNAGNGNASSGSSASGTISSTQGASTGGAGESDYKRAFTQMKKRPVFRKHVGV